MQTYKELKVWQKSIELVVCIYEVTKYFPSEEKFGLTSQMRRAAVSISSNIAEGYARKNKKENAHFVNISFASATELETQIIIAKKLEYATQYDWSHIDGAIDHVLRMLYNYRKSLTL